MSLKDKKITKEHNINQKRVLLIGFLLSGFAALIYEVAWTRILTLSFGTNTYSFSIMLAAFFTGLSLGGYFAGKYLNEKIDAVKLFSYLEIGIGISGLFIFFFIDRIDIPLYLFYRISDSFYLFMALLFCLSFLFMLIPTILMGATLPVVSRIYVDEKERIGTSIGEVFSFNTIGGVFGSFSAGFIFIPIMGIEKTVVVASFINLLAAFMIFYFFKKEGRMKFYKILSLAILILLYSSSFSLNPLVAGVYEMRDDPGGELEKYMEEPEIISHGNNAYGTVVVADRGKFRSLWINNKVDASTTPFDMRTQLLLGYLPLFANPGSKSVLNIGIGGGFTLGAIEAFNVSEIDVVELNPLVAEAADKYFSKYNRGALEDDRADITIADARNFLALSGKNYDVIISEPSNLWVSGESGLFTKEFYGIVKDHMNENGIFSQWIPMYDLSEEDAKIFLRTINGVFPYTALWISGADGIILASNEPVVMDYNYITRMLDQNQRLRSDLNDIAGDFVSEEGGVIIPKIIIPDVILGSYALSDEEMDAYAGNAPFHTDDYPVLEFTTARNLLFLKDKTSSIDDINEYMNKRIESKNSSVPVLNIAHQEGEWQYLDFMNLKINAVNWSMEYSGYRVPESNSLISESGYRRLAAFNNGKSSFKIAIMQSKLKSLKEDSREITFVKNAQRYAELKALLQKKYPAYDIRDFEKNGHKAFMIEYTKGQRNFAIIAWYCDINEIIYYIDVDANDEKDILRINNDIICLHDNNNSI